MAHQFGLNQQADSRWLALTRAIGAGARWLDQVLQQFPSPEAILGCPVRASLRLGAGSVTANLGTTASGEVARDRVERSAALSCDASGPRISPTVGRVQ